MTSSATHLRFDATQAAGAILVEHCDIPDGMTISEWRTVRAAEQRAAREACRSERGLLRRALRRH
jgi:hypothetical protein